MDYGFFGKVKNKKNTPKFFKIARGAILRWGSTLVHFVFVLVNNNTLVPFVTTTTLVHFVLFELRKIIGYILFEIK